MLPTIHLARTKSTLLSPAVAQVEIGGRRRQGAVHGRDGSSTGGAAADPGEGEHGRGAGEGTRPRRILGRGSTAAELGRGAGHGRWRWAGGWGRLPVEMGGVAGAAGGGGRRSGDGGGERMGAMEKMGG